MILSSSSADILAFAIVCLTMVCTPGPNMLYLISRSITQGSRAGLISLCGVAAAFAVYMVASVLGLTALLIAVPYAFNALRLIGAGYLLWLCWQSIRPGARSPFEVRALPMDSPARLVAMGFVTNILNPKAVILYLSLLPQFIRPANGSVFVQGIVLGTTQIGISVVVNAIIILAAGTIARFLAVHPTWQLVQRWLMGAVLGGLAIRMAAEVRR